MKMQNSKRFLALLLAVVLVFTLAACGGKGDGSSAAGKYTPGTYEASAAGMNGDVKVSVTVDANAITAVEVVEHAETPGISDPAIEQIPAAIVEANSAEVDAVAGATVTSKAIMAAVTSALAQAEGKEVPADSSSEAQELAFTDPDVIIVGAGFSGMNAALEASSNGAKVMLIDKNNAMGGSIRYAGGTLSGAGTKMQKEAGVEDSPEDFIADIERMGGGLNVPELTRKHVENAAAAVDWMDSLGADFGDRQPKQPQTYDAFEIPREHRVTGGGKAMVEIVQPLLEEKVAEGNLEILLNTEVDDIILEDGAVVGVVLTDGTEYRAKSIILATGGYGHNEEWLHKYNYENVLTTSPEFVTGDGYVFAEKAGAVFNNMDYLPAYAGGVPVSDTGFVRSVTAKETAYPGAIWVNMDGERMLDEYNCLDSEKKHAWATAPHNIVYILISQEMRDTQDPILSVNSQGDEGWVRFDEELAKGEVVFKGDTVEELAAQIGVDAAALKNTIDTYNADCAAGKDSQFGRTESLIPLEGTLYAVKTVPYVMLTKGGPLMNENAQVLNADGEPIPGLFECGELAGGANIGGGCNIGGLANTSCIVWGKIAGASAASYALEG